MKIETEVNNTQVVDPVTTETTVVTDGTIAPVVPEVITPTQDELANTLIDKLLSEAGLSDEEHDKLYELQIADMDKSIIEDAKLSSESRKKLAASTFCGPAKSFPVPDCAHVVAARKLIGRYKGEGSKDSILSCVSRKAKALGCETKDEVQPNVSASVEPEKKETEVPLVVTLSVTDGVASAEEKSVLAKDILGKLVSTLGEENIVKAVLDSKLAIAPTEIKALVDEVAGNENTIGELRDQLASLRRELKAAYNDVITVEDQLVSAKETVRSGKTDKAYILHTLEGSLTDEVKSQILTLNDESLDSVIKTMSAKVDIVKIADKLNSGLSRIPEEEVVVPVVSQDSTNEVKPKPTYRTQTMVDDVYRRILLSQGHEAATAFYEDSVKTGLASLKD